MIKLFQLGLVIFVFSFVLTTSDLLSEERWVEAEGMATVTGISPEAAGQLALDQARKSAVSRELKDILSTASLLTEERNEKQFQYYQQKISSRTYGRILKEEIVCDSFISTVGPTGARILTRLIRIRALV